MFIVVALALATVAALCVPHAVVFRVTANRAQSGLGPAPDTCNASALLKGLHACAMATMAVCETCIYRKVCRCTAGFLFGTKLHDYALIYHFKVIHQRKFAHMGAGSNLHRL